MEEKIICNKEDLVAIADATRNATGSTDTYSVSELSEAAVEIISSGGVVGSKDAVLYTEQSLTYEQRAQARENIGAINSWDEFNDKPFYENITVGDEIMPETELAYDEEMAALPLDSSLFTGEETGLRVTFDGETYDCSVYKLMETYTLCGNSSLFDPGLTNTGEPFCVVIMPMFGMCGVIAADTESHTVGITELNIDRKKIENKFIDSEWLAVRNKTTNEILTETNFTFDGSSPYAVPHSFEGLFSCSPLQCIVNWNGESYECGGSFFIGFDLNTFSATGQYPFGILFQEDTIHIFPAEGHEGTTNTISITMTLGVPVVVPEPFLPIASVNNAGIMSTADKTKLDSLSKINIDTTLLVSGSAADAKVTGTKITTAQNAANSAQTAANQASENSTAAANAAFLGMPGSLKWDGVIGDKEYVVIEQSDGPMLAYVRISGEVPVNLAEAMATVGAYELGGGMFAAMTGVRPIDDTGTVYAIGEGEGGMIIVTQDNVTLEGITFPKKGIYAMAYSGLLLGMDISLFWANALYILGHVFSDSTSGNYFETKTKTTTTNIGETLTWDGNVNGMVTTNNVPSSPAEGVNVTTNMFVKVSDSTPSFDLFPTEGIATSSVLNGSENSSMSNAIISDDELLASIGGWAIVLQPGKVNGSITFPETGVYANIQEGTQDGVAVKYYASSLTLPGYDFSYTDTKTFTTIKYEHLPDALQFGETSTYSDTLTWDGDPRGQALLLDSFYKISDKVFTKDDFPNGVTVTVVDRASNARETMNFEQGHLVVNGDLLACSDEYFVSMPLGNQLNPDLSGTYVLCVDDMYVESIATPGINTFGTYELKTIDPKYLPAGVGGGTGGGLVEETDPTVPAWAKAATKPTYTASEIGAGTFTGQVIANSSAQTPSTSLLRNSKLVSADTNPTVNGEICWTYK